MEITKAICIITGNNINGKITFEQISKSNNVKINGIVYGLKEGKHGFHIHEYGDQTNGCISMGGHFNPYKNIHGDIKDENRHVGDLGNVIADKNGICRINIVDNLISLNGINSIIGRGIVIHENEDDLGRGNNVESRITGNAGKRVCCGIIACSK